MKLAAERPTTQSARIFRLEQRADEQDKIIKPMADQVGELYGLLEKARNINWFVVKVLTGVAGAFGFCAVVLTIAANLAKLFGR